MHPPCTSPTMHAPLPYMPPAKHTPCHAHPPPCTPPAMHAPPATHAPLPCMSPCCAQPSCHTCPPDTPLPYMLPPENRITDACENITLPQLHLGGKDVNTVLMWGQQGSFPLSLGTIMLNQVICHLLNEIAWSLLKVNWSSWRKR